MNYKIIIIPEAKADYKKSLLWYKVINSNLARKFNDSFKESLTRLKNDPLLFQIKYDNTRIIFFKIFPYAIHYSIYQDKIVIKSIFHTSRDSDLNLF
ncbi:type II toxin-antitoxin system RelE/ParE family toxin [Flavobacterium branchiicola]|uniref:Type II toxin-antitoxin system RelE/ParE family toxin n=1 Tax=Flavobacterium branchiicola TaxID=1114875 RepID=A0ABV9PEU7_9FLAO|nr:type II toxin-antitoxin system RelE/ParE family toxin [Flavobacterium branchiicola]